MEEKVTLNHGSGGLKSDELIKMLLIPNVGNEKLNKLGDGAYISLKGELAVSTDSFVINPIFFKGGDIGKLSVCGTVNDLIMCGAYPKYLSLSLIIEEGLEISKLKKVIESIGDTCRKAGVQIITGDTKVVEKGHGDGVFINTTGIGLKADNMNLCKERIESGDVVIVTGNVGDHGISILCERGNFLQGDLKSDCRPLVELCEVVFPYGDNIKILRDPTRGGVATTLNEFVEGTNLSIEIEEEEIPICQEVLGASEILGVEPLYAANEGKALIICKEEVAKDIINSLKKTELGKDAAIIGRVVDYEKEKVFLRGLLGGRRILNKLTNDLLPRIC